MRRYSLATRLFSHRTVGALAALSILLTSVHWSVAQDRPPLLPYAVLDTVCCPFPKMRFTQHPREVSAQVPLGKRDLTWSKVQLLLTGLKGLELNPGFYPSHQVALNALSTLSSVHKGAYYLYPFYAELAYHRRLLSAADQRQWVRDSLDLEALARQGDSLSEAHAREHLLLQGRRIDTLPPVQFLYGFTCGRPRAGMRLHYGDACPAVRACRDQPVNLRIETAAAEGFEVCGWCHRNSRPRATPKLW